MIWNEKILFLHVPKAAGMSVSDLLLNGLKGQVSITEPCPERKKIGNVLHIPGKRHETLFDAESYFTYINKSCLDFEKIFVVMRSPYDLEVSRYFYLKKGYEIDKGPAQAIAMNSSFKEYLATAPFFGQFPPRLDRYFHMHGSIPNNLVVLKHEYLTNDISFHLSPYLQEGVRLDHINQSNRRPADELYDSESEGLCYNRHKWFFDKGFYSRRRF